MFLIAKMQDGARPIDTDDYHSIRFTVRQVNNRINNTTAEYGLGAWGTRRIYCSYVHHSFLELQKKVANDSTQY